QGCLLAPALVGQGDEAAVGRAGAILTPHPELAIQLLAVVEPPSRRHHRPDREPQRAALVLVLRGADGDELSEAGAPLVPNAAAVGAPVRHRPAHRLELAGLHRAAVEAHEAVDRAHRRSISANDATTAYLATSCPP